MSAPLRSFLAGTAVAAVLAAAPAAFARNVILFVPDGLRQGIVTADTAPTMAALRDEGVNFTNPHSVFPTFTLPNASVFATGHYIGDTGMFGNAMYMPFPVDVTPGKPTVTPFFENDFALAEMAKPEHAGDFIEPETLIAAARAKGLSVAAIGKLGPVGLQDIKSLRGRGAYIIDDTTGAFIDTPAGVVEAPPLPPDLAPSIAARVGGTAAPGRGENGRGGDCGQHGTRAPNLQQQRWFTDVATSVVLPRFKDAGKPFFMVFWARDPDGTQHNQGDSYGKVVPGINGETSLRAIANSDDSLRQIRRALKQLGLEGDTDIIVSADHGFSTIAKDSKTSPSARVACADDDKALAQGFVGLDLAKALSLPITDPDSGKAIDAEHGVFSLRGNAMLGDPKKPAVVVVANGGSDTIYLPGGNAALAKRIVDFLMTQDYTSGLFVDDALGKVPGTLPMSAINWRGSSQTRHPSILVNFRSFVTDCGRDAPLCTAEIADSTLIQGQGMHGSFSRADTANFMAAAGPSFQKGIEDPTPVSNADIGATIASLLGLTPQSKGKLTGRVVSEALQGGDAVPFEHLTMSSAPGVGGLVTVLEYQKAGSRLYFDAAGFPGRTVGLKAAGDGKVQGSSSSR